MKQNPNNAARRLRPIPNNTVVHTPTEEEATELLAILHENGYRWCGGSSLLEESEWEMCEEDTCYYISQYVEYGPVKERNEDTTTLLTLAEFKEKYVLNEDNFAKSEVEKPQQKFKVGDKVRIIQDDSVNPAYVGIVDEIVSIGYRIQLKNTDSNWSEDVLEPYTEPETKEETKEETMETKELNLCELLKGHEGECVYSLIDGEGEVAKFDKEGFLVNGWLFCKDGTLKGNETTTAKCLIFPSRALYEQYPLDPYTAWMKWQEEQKKYSLIVDVSKCDNEKFIGGTKFPKLAFHTPADRDKCIEEIKAIIEKYSKK